MIASKKKRGAFTLIEILVVVGIIGMLGAIAATALGTMRIRAHDARRISDLAVIANALELYLQDNGSYPPPACGYGCNQFDVSSNPATWNSLQAHLSPYLAKLPLDPINKPGNGACNEGTTWIDCRYYAYGNVTSPGDSPQYDLITLLENKAHPRRCELIQYPSWIFGDSWCGDLFPVGHETLYDVSPK